MPKAAQVDRRAPCTSPAAMTSITAGPGDSDSATSVSTYSQYVSQLTAVSTAAARRSSSGGWPKNARRKVFQRREHLVRPLGHQRMAASFENDDRRVGAHFDQRAGRSHRSHQVQFRSEER